MGKTSGRPRRPLRSSRTWHRRGRPASGAPALGCRSAGVLLAAGTGPVRGALGPAGGAEVAVDRLAAGALPGIVRGFLRRTGAEIAGGRVPAGAGPAAGGGLAVPAALGCCAPIWKRDWAFMPPIWPAIFAPIKAMAGPADSLDAAACIAAACAPTSVAAAMVGLRKAASRCSCLIICSSSSLALTLETPTETISMPRSLRHFSVRTSFKASASSMVWPGRAE